MGEAVQHRFDVVVEKTMVRTVRGLGCFDIKLIGVYANSESAYRVKQRVENHWMLYDRCGISEDSVTVENMTLQASVAALVERCSPPERIDLWERVTADVSPFIEVQIRRPVVTGLPRFGWPIYTLVRVDTDGEAFCSSFDVISVHDTKYSCSAAKQLRERAWLLYEKHDIPIDCTAWTEVHREHRVLMLDKIDEAGTENWGQLCRAEMEGTEFRIYEGTLEL